MLTQLSVVVQVVNTRRGVVVYQIGSLDRHVLISTTALFTQDPDSFKKKLCNLGKYHARNIHQWEGGTCDFHSLKTCICKQYNEDDELTCDGKLYATKSPLTCPLHALAYEIECDERASRAYDLIHPVLGRGHSNLPEASHNVLVRFRSKNLHLHRLHYITSTNLGLCQSNMTWLTGKREVYITTGC